MPIIPISPNVADLGRHVLQTYFHPFLGDDLARHWEVINIKDGRQGQVVPTRRGGTYVAKTSTADCNATPTNLADLSAQMSQYKIDIGEFDLTTSICWKDIVSYPEYQDAFGTTPIEAIYSTPEFMGWFEEYLLRAASLDVFRNVWLGDKNAAVYSAGGNMTNTAIVPYYNTFNGFLKQIKANAKRTVCTPNAAATYVLQEQGLTAQLAYDLYETMIATADPIMSAVNTGVSGIRPAVICTNMYFQKLLMYFTRMAVNAGFVQTVIDGRQRYFLPNGMELINMPILDGFIKTDQIKGANSTSPRFDPIFAALVDINGLILHEPMTHEMLANRSGRDVKTDELWFKGYYGGMPIVPSADIFSAIF